MTEKEILRMTETNEDGRHVADGGGSKTVTMEATNVCEGALEFLKNEDE